MKDEKLTMAQIRGHLHVSQTDLAGQLNATQSGVLKIERSADPQLSTLRRYFDGLAALTNRPVRLVVNVETGNETYALRTVERAGAVGSDPMRTQWRLRAWDDAELELRWQDEDVIAVSDDETGDLTDWPGDAEVRRRIGEEMVKRGDPRSSQALGTFITYWRYFREEMQVGDLVAVPLVGRRVAVAEITGEYEYRADETDSKMRHVRSVRWLKRASRDALDESLLKVVNAPGTVCRIRKGDLSALLVRG